MKKWDIWMEGFSVTGNHAKAGYEGSYEGETFDDAVLAYKKAKGRSEKDDPQKNRLGNWNTWGCQLYDNEADARKSFG